MSFHKSKTKLLILWLENLHVLENTLRFHQNFLVIPTATFVQN